jgi:two-component system, OmpR family, response regulator
MRILLVEDDAKIASFILSGLKQSGYAVCHRGDGLSAFTAASSECFDLLIVDIMIPGIDGLSLIEQLRKCNNDTPVIILSAKQSVDDRVRGLKIGGDDYITKPFAFAELLARIQSLTRRIKGVAETTRLSFDGLEMDLLARRVVRNGQPVDLQPREFALLEYLLRNAGRVVSKTMIMEHVWNFNFDPESNVIEARLCRQREKIDAHCPKKLIHTVRGVGYVLGNPA